MSIREERKQQSRQALLEAALNLSTSGRSFSSISLREVAREVGLVPTAFYRHFQDMDDLAKELVDQVALHLKTILHQLAKSYLNQPNTDIVSSIDLFFQTVEQYPQAWIFIISERWGGAQVLRDAIAREIEDLNYNFSLDLAKLVNFQHIQNNKDIKTLANILINLSFTWAMTWIDLNRNLHHIDATAADHAVQVEQIERDKSCLRQQSIHQVKLLFRGIASAKSI